MVSHIAQSTKKNVWDVKTANNSCLGERQLLFRAMHLLIDKRNQKSDLLEYSKYV